MKTDRSHRTGDWRGSGEMFLGVSHFTWHFRLARSCVYKGRDVPRILLLRNYKECVVNQSASSDLRNRHTQDNIIKYCENIMHYHESPSKIPGIVVYYESLLTDPLSSLEEIVNWLDTHKLIDNHVSVSQMRVNLHELIKSIDDHKAQCLDGYKNGTRGRFGMSQYDLLYHSKKMDKELRLKWDERMQQVLPSSIFKERCSRYLEK